MKIKGIVTAVHEENLTVELDKRTTVHLTLLFLSKFLRKLPLKESEIEITSTHFVATDLNVDCVVLCEKSQMQGDFSIPLKKVNKFQQLATKHNLGPIDLLEIDKNHRILKRNFCPPYNLSCDDILMEIIDILPKSNVLPCDPCLKRTLPHFDLNLIRNLNFINTENINYEKFAFWTHGIHRSQRYLIGLLFTHPSNGTIYLTDHHTEIPCVITNLSSCDINKYLNKYILIQECTAFTEIYCNKRIDVIHYLLLDYQQVLILNLPQMSCTPTASFPLQASSPPYNSNQNSFRCKIIHKSMPHIDFKTNKPEYWIKVKSEDKQFYLCLKNQFLGIYPLIEEQKTYKVIYTNQITKAYSSEIKSIEPSVPLFELPSEAVFIPQENKSNQLECLLPDIIEAHQLLQLPGLISFQGIISIKKFVNPISSRTSANITQDNFGLPGNKTHVLEFKTTDKKTVSVFLNNWECVLSPLGLLPYMRVAVKNVVSQKGKYFKSTILTHFEIQGYEPPMNFQTASLGSDDEWGLPFYLGAGSLLPQGVIIWCKVESVCLLGAKIYHTCKNCHTTVHLKYVCTNCGGESKELSTIITLITHDRFGESKITAKGQVGLLLLQLLLGAQKPVFNKWCKGFNVVDEYIYCKNKTQLDETEVGYEFKKAITRHFEVIEEFGLSLELKCRKSPDTDKSSCVYFLMDVRRPH